MGEILLTQGRVTTVDDADLGLLSRYSWHAVIQSGRWYARARLKGAVPYRHTYMHRVLLGIEWLSGPSVQVDHVNGDSLDNRRSNLRLANQSQNNCNRPTRSKTGFRGVVAHEGRFASQITVNGKRIHLGRFADPVDAARAYNAAAINLRGEFATLNAGV